MKTYIRIYGPPVLKAIRTLEKLAIDNPQVCIMDPFIQIQPMLHTDREIGSYFFNRGMDISGIRCNSIISKSGWQLGDYDFYFDWFKDPSAEELDKLIEKIDEALAPLGCKYTVTTK